MIREATHTLPLPQVCGSGHSVYLLYIDTTMLQAPTGATTAIYHQRGSSRRSSALTILFLCADNYLRTLLSAIRIPKRLHKTPPSDTRTYGKLPFLSTVFTKKGHFAVLPVLRGSQYIIRGNIHTVPYPTLPYIPGKQLSAMRSTELVVDHSECSKLPSYNATYTSRVNINTS